MRSISVKRAHPYYIVAPEYRRTSAGIRVMHMLCDILNRSGQEAYVISPTTSPALVTPQLTEAMVAEHQAAGLEPIVVYPEVVPGNPVRGKVVVRYLLNQPGFLGLGGDFADSDILFAYTKALLQEGMPSENVMFLPAIDRSIFRPPENPSKRIPGKVCYYQGRSPNALVGKEKLPADAVEITMEYPSSWEELADLFQSCEYFYCATASGLAGEAILCGCVTITPHSPAAPLALAKEELGLDGCAWGDEPAEIERARNSVHLFQEKLQKMEERFWPQLDHFIEVTQQAAQLEKLRTQRRLSGMRTRVGVLTEAPLDGRYFRLRLGDALALMSATFETCFHQNSAQYLLNGVYPFPSDADYLAYMDLFVVQGAFPSPKHQVLLEAMIASGKPIIYEVSDDLLAILKEPALDTAIPHHAETIKWLLAHCHLVVVSSENLAEAIRPFNEKILVWPYALAQARLVAPLVKRDNAIVTIACAHPELHRQELALLAPVLERIVQQYAGRVNLIFWGEVPPALLGKPGVRKVSMGESYQQCLPELAALGIDIALLPVVEGELDHAKADLAWLEYAAVGAATLASDTFADANLQASHLAGRVKNTADAWFEAIAKLIDLPVQRTHLANQARAYVLKHRLLEHSIRPLFHAWNSVLPAELRSTELPQLGMINTTDDIADFDPSYQQWLEDDRAQQVQRQQLAEYEMKTWANPPVFNLIVLAPQLALARLPDSFESMEQQLYPHWRLIVLADTPCPDPILEQSDQLGWLQLERLDDEQLAMALNGLVAELPADYMMLLPAGFRLQPHALVQFGAAMQANPEWGAVYCNSDVVSPMGSRFKPVFRSDFSPNDLASADYIGCAVVLAINSLVSMGGFQAFPDAYNYDVLLRLLEAKGAKAIGHIDEMLLSTPWRDPKHDNLGAASRRVALENHAARLGKPVTVAEG